MLKNISIVLRGSLASQAIGFLVLPLLTRLFTPEAFGHLQLFQTILTMLLVFATLRYEVAILRADSPEELDALLWLCAGITLGIGVVMAIGMVVLQVIGWSSALAQLPFSIWLFPLGFVIAGFGQFLSYLVTREQLFAMGANAKIIQATGYAGTASGLGFVTPGLPGLILADLAGRTLNLAWLGRWFFASGHTRIAYSGWDEVKAVARKFREYPIIAMPGGLINAAGGVLTPLMIYATFNPATAGQFSLVERALALPVGLMVIAVSQAYTTQLAEKMRAGADNLQGHFRKIVGWLFVVGIVPAIGVMIAAPWAIDLVFGHQWVAAGGFARIMAPAFLMMFVAGGVNMTLSVLGFQRMQMVWEVGRLVTMFILWASAVRLGLPVTTVVFGHAGVICLASLCFLLITDRMLAIRDASARATA